MANEASASATAVLDPEVEEATRSALGHREAYAARKSKSTRNPHSAKKGRPLEELMKLKFEERILVQWRQAFGCPISDEAKAQFTIECLGHTFQLADVRLWLERHPQKGRQELNTRVVYLEFFFDGMLAEIQEDPAVFSKAFEDLIEKQLQAHRRKQFKSKLAARRRAVEARDAKAVTTSVEDAEGGSSKQDDFADDRKWQAFLHRPVEPLELVVQSTREAGCMIRFIVCQTSISVSAAEQLGQLAFPEHFPIDGKEQELSVSTKPLPRWVYCVGFFTAIYTLVATLILIAAFKPLFIGSPQLAP
jgi:hypothetical protein